jgi:carbon-monoxide dehydrogenase large subunit
VRFVGEPIAAVVGADAYLLEDAAQLIDVDIALRAAAVGWQAHEQPDADLAYERDRSFGERSASPVAVDGRFTFARVNPLPIETCGCIAEYDWSTGRLTLWSSTQIPFLVRSLLSEHIDVPEHLIDVIAPDVGGAFGQKGNLFPEEVLVCLLARELGTAVRWIEDRSENLAARTHAKAQIIDLEVALDPGGRLLGMDVSILGEGGAYNTCPFTLLIDPLTAASNLTGPYRVSWVRERVRAQLSNTCPMGAYRGVGYGMMQAAREALLDRAARLVGLSPFEIRRRNVVDAFPYRAHNAVLSEGSYLASIDALERAVDYGAFQERQARLRGAGRLVGLGVSVFNELTGGSTKSTYVTGFDSTTHDTATIRVEASGTLTVTTSLVPQGQGHATTFAQVAADALGVPVADVVVRSGHTSHTWGMGTWGSRGAIIGAGTIARAAEPLRRKLVATAAHLLEASTDDVELGDGHAFVNGSPWIRLPLSEVASKILFSADDRPPEIEPTLEATASFDPAQPIFANGAHAAIVEVDPETGAVTIERIIVVEDCGVLINPAIVEGQVQGGMAQAIGQAFYEELVYDSEGQLLTSTLADYLPPTACETAPIEIIQLETPSAFTAGGVKGCGEAAMTGAPAAFLCAVNDALAPLGVELNDLPMTPQRILAALAGAPER